jgi:serine/threonine protein kinase
MRQGGRIVGAHLVEPGSVLADRYVIEDLLAEEGDSDSWRARDKVLARSVVLQILPSSSPYAHQLVAAAKRASRVGDPRILQVLDAVDDGELTYIVREWANGQSLDVILSEGPMPARRATWMMREVAAAMSSAHRMGLPHRRLAPDTVVVTKSSGIKLIGLGTFAALQADGGDADPQRQDTRDLGKLLYACLTARWPGGPNAGLPAAPTEHGRLLRPRQVRAGVPRSLDAVCDRVLADPPRYGRPITTVEEINETLNKILAEEGFTGVGSVGLASPAGLTTPTTAEPPPALLNRDEGGPTTGEQPASSAAHRQTSSLGRTAMWGIVAVLVLGAMLLAFLVGQHGGDDTPATDQTPSSSNSTASAALKQLPIAGGQDFDPEGTAGENPEEVPLAFDDKAATAWQTMTYFTQLSKQKSGVGLIVDLGKVQEVARVDVRLVGGPTDLELRTAPSDATRAPTGSADDYQVVQRLTGAGPDATFAMDKPVDSRFLLIWLTELPEVSSGSWKSEIAEIKVYG